MSTHDWRMPHPAVLCRAFNVSPRRWSTYCIKLTWNPWNNSVAKGSLLIYYPSLERLQIHDDCNSLWSFPLVFYQKLKLLRVNASENLESLSISEGSHQDLTSLAQLDIWFCPNFVSFPCGGLFAPNLTKKFIHECEKLKSRPEGMNTLLPSLESLQLYACPKL